MISTQQLSATIEAIAVPGKGILAADESTSTITKRFQSINVESTEENRRIYRSLLCTTPNIQDYINGVILYEETLGQKTDQGQLIPLTLEKNHIVPGIKVDKGLVDFQNSTEEKVTQGLDDLDARMNAYKQQHARFAKWRVVFSISSSLPTQAVINANAESLAKYAAICQKNGIVPIVEPEVLMEGSHTLLRCHEVTSAVLKTVFETLPKHGVILDYIILKPNMVVPGKECADQRNPEAIATATLDVLKTYVPAAVPTINFLSGGQSAVDATINLNAINSQGKQPWLLSYSYGRALQDPCLKAWKGNLENINAAQKELFKRAKLNSLASLGKYNVSMENEG
ncbi:MAG: fructose-bisphosphate aldolase class I [Proteobacteria bacterium]|nr:fructose-bisphosphate aldolase class I [Pseudomonadota bacterium]